MALKREYLLRRSPRFPDKEEYMEIVPEVGRILASAVVPEFKSGIAPIALEYIDTCEGEVLMRLRPNNGWNSHKYIYRENSMIWTSSEVAAQSWWIIRAQDMQEWWEDFKERAWEQMDLRLEEKNSEKED